jgi:hypothetical protein
MLNTYIKNRGTSKTIVHDNDRNYVNDFNWDADYDGNVANISIQTNTNGETEHFDVTLNNDDLAHLLNVQSVNIPIDKRLENDFQRLRYTTPNNYFVEIPDRYISSPTTDEVFLPLSTPTRKYKKRHKTHVTHKLYKKTKSKHSSSTAKKTRRRHTL